MRTTTSDHEGLIEAKCKVRGQTPGVPGGERSRQRGLALRKAWTAERLLCQKSREQQGLQGPGWSGGSECRSCRR